MAGGQGTRLRPLTNEIPKPLISIIDKPVMEHIIELLKAHNITEIAVTLGYKADKIISYFGDGSRLGVTLTYYIEDTPLGTAGSVRNALDFIQSNVLIISGDAFTDINLTKLIEYHNRKQALATLATVDLDDARGYGLVACDANGAITSFIEKPSIAIAGSVNTGIYVISRKVIEQIPQGKIDWGMDIFPNLKKGLYSYHAECYWSDIGTLPSYYMTNYYVATHNFSLSQSS